MSSVVRAAAEPGTEATVEEFEGADELDSPLEPIDDGPSLFHIDLDVHVTSAAVKFVSPADVVPALCPVDESCTGLDIGSEVLRGTIGLGLGGFTVEGSIDLSLRESARDYFAWSVGARIETSDEAWLAVQFRFAYVGRLGALEGRGGRAGIGVLLRPFPWIAAYGEVSADVTTVPSQMADSGVLFSYATFLGGGVRTYLGR